MKEKKNEIKKVFLDELPKWKNTKNIDKINWKESVNYKIKGIYENIKFEFKIIDYIPKKQMLNIEYNNNLFNIKTTNLIKCRLGNILGVYTSDFKIEIGTRFQDDKRDIVITDRKREKDKNGREWKYYKYECNICGWKEGWIKENNLKKNQGCSCCYGRTTVEGINDIPTVAPWMIKYFQGGYNEAKLYTAKSNKKIIPICPDCGRVKDKSILINTIFNEKSIGCSCSDNVSYVEKFMFSCLGQLKLNFRIQLSKKDFNWIINDKRYDFYFEYNNEQYIIETHGEQHYKESSNWKMSLEEVQNNDKLKKELAISNGIKPENYIVIDCRESTLEWIRDNDNGILNSRLNEIFDLSKINWLKCNEFALSNLVKIACDLWESGIHNTKEISEIMKYSRVSITKWLNNGNGIWCNYNPKEEQIKNGKINGELTGKNVEVFKNEISLGIFESAKKISENSLNIFGVKFQRSAISLVCNSKQKNHKDYIFKYV